MTHHETTTVGLKMLKENLAQYVARAREGEHVIITDRGEEVAELVPLSPERRAILRLVAAGIVQWNGRRPQLPPPIPYDGPSISEAMVEDRR